MWYTAKFEDGRTIRTSLTMHFVYELQRTLLVTDLWRQNATLDLITLVLEHLRTNEDPEALLMYPVLQLS